MTTPPPSGAWVERRFEAVSAFLAAHRPQWEERPFVSDPLCWEAEHDELSGWLRGLDLAALERWEPVPDDTPAPGAFRGWSDEARTLVDLARLDGEPPGFNFRCRAVPGRKVSQVRAFAAQVAARAAGQLSVVEWCAGKGHLGRALQAATDLPVVCVERDGLLVAEGERLANHMEPTVSFVQADVRLDPAAVQPLGAATTAVALHACGVLTDTLLRRGVERGSSVVVAPCCYHRVDPPGHVPMSARGRALDLHLRPDQLRLATAEEVTSNGRARRHRRRNLAWRLGLDLAVRAATDGERSGLGMRLSGEEVDLPFEDFCLRLTARHGVALPARWDAVAAEAAGRQRAHRVRALGLVRALFRRALEVWVVLDKALFLLEAGREVEVGTFCPHEVTPRNLLLASR